MATVILATGLVAIYKSYLLCLDQQTYLIHRIYANNLLDKKIFETERLYQEKGESAIKEEMTEPMVIHNKNLIFEVKAFIQEVRDLEDILQLDIGVFWPEGGRLVRLTKSVYISR